MLALAESSVKVAQKCINRINLASHTSSENYTILKGLKITSMLSRRPRPRPAYLTVTKFINLQLYTRIELVQTTITASESKISLKKMS